MGLFRQEGPKQVLGGLGDVRADVEGLAVQGGGDRVDHPVQEFGDSLRLGAPLVPGRHVQALGGEAEGEGVAGCEGQPGGAGGDAAGRGVLEQPPRLGAGQAVQASDAQGVGPGRVGAPAQSRWLAAGEHDQGAGRQAGEVAIPEPVLQRAEPVGAVHEEYRPAGARDVCRGGECLLGGSGACRVHLDDEPSPPPGLDGEPAQQLGLADAAGAVQGQHRNGAGRLVQRGTEPGQFALPADEAAQERLFSVADGGIGSRPPGRRSAVRVHVVTATSGRSPLLGTCTATVSASPALGGAVGGHPGEQPGGPALLLGHAEPAEHFESVGEQPAGLRGVVTEQGQVGEVDAYGGGAGLVEDVLAHGQRAGEVRGGFGEFTEVDVDPAEVVEDVSLTDHIAVVPDHAEAFDERLAGVGGLPAVQVHLTRALEHPGLPAEVSEVAPDLQRLVEFGLDPADVAAPQEDDRALDEDGGAGPGVVVAEVPLGALEQVHRGGVMAGQPFQQPEVAAAQPEPLGVAELLEESDGGGQRPTGLGQVTAVQVQ